MTTKVSSNASLFYMYMFSILLVTRVKVLPVSDRIVNNHLPELFMYLYFKNGHSFLSELFIFLSVLIDHNKDIRKNMLCSSIEFL